MLIQHRSLRLALGFVLSGSAVLAVAQISSATVTPTNSAPAVANAIGTNTGSAFTLTPAPPSQAGTGDNAPALSGFPTAGATYGILTSGNAGLADDPNSGTGDGSNLGINDPSRG